MPDQIHILMPDQSIHTVDIRAGEIYIGRNADNDIVIDHPSVSRVHARLDFDGDRYTITDLDSLNGTFIDNVELASRKPQTWIPGTNIRFGDIWLRIEHASQSRTTQSNPPPATKPSPAEEVPDDDDTAPSSNRILQRIDGRSIQLSQLKLSTAMASLGVFLDSYNINVSPGNAVSLSFEIFNLGSTESRYQVQFDGIPPTWIGKTESIISIKPDQSSEVSLKITPLRAPGSKAGRYPCRLLVRDLSSRLEHVEIRLSLTILAFSEFRSSIDPDHIKAGGIGQVILQNLGNTPEIFSIRWEDPRRELSFNPASAKVTVAPAQTAQIEFGLDVLKPHLFGKERLYTFISHISTPSGKQESHPGEYSGTALIPTWVPLAFIPLCLLVACMLVFFANTAIAPSRTATAIVGAAFTKQHDSTQAVFSAQTATEFARQQVLQETAFAITATATWQQADTDGDGLSNAQEQQLFTKPDDPDTDNDGLNDGDEVNHWKTFPLIPDTDGDGLIDGEEVNVTKTDPLNSDTDGDGIEDSLDPDPLVALTPSHTPTQTDTPSPSDTPTLTPTPSQSPTPTMSPTARPTNTDLLISITNGGTSSVPGTSILYTIIVQNDADFLIEDVHVETIFSTALENIAWSCSGEVGSTCADTSGSGEIDAYLSMGPSGKIAFIIDASIDPNASGLLINSSRVSPPPGIYDTNSINNLAIDSDTLTPQVSFELTKTDDRTNIAPGDETEYMISLHNSGPSAANGVTIVDIFPDTIENINWICTASVGAKCGTTGNRSGNINLKVNLAPGGSVTVAASGNLSSDATGVLSNTVSLTSPIDPQQNNQSVTDTTNITPHTDLEITLVAPDQVSASDQIIYTILVVNHGPSEANNVILISQLPPNATFSSSDPDSPACSLTNDILECQLGNLGSGDNIQIQVTLIAPSGSTQLVYHASVTGSETDPNLQNNAITAEVEVN